MFLYASSYSDVDRDGVFGHSVAVFLEYWFLLEQATIISQQLGGQCPFSKRQTVAKILGQQSLLGIGFSNISFFIDN